MQLPPGLWIGDRYRIRRLVGGARDCRVYLAESEAGGAGRVALKVARHDEVGDVAGLLARRTRIEDEFRILVRLQSTLSSVVPLPIELVRSYPVEPRLRALVRAHPELRATEPYLIREFVDGESLRRLLARAPIDEERALWIALRIGLFVRRARHLGIELQAFRPEGFLLDATGENLSVVDASWCRPVDGDRRYLAPDAPPPPPDIAQRPMPAAFGRLLVTLLGGAAAPDWPLEADWQPRWEELLAARRVPPSLRNLALTCLGYAEPRARRVGAVIAAIRNELALGQVVFRSGHGGVTARRTFPLAPGARLGERFVIGAPFAEGGRGFLYRARDTRSGVEHVVKANKYVYDSGQEFRRERTQRRQELAHEYAVLRHFASRTNMVPQPVALLRERGAGSWFDLAPHLAEGEPWLVMKRIGGRRLLDLLPAPLAADPEEGGRENHLAPRLVVRIVSQLADLLAAFHAEGYLFQDLKPENILYDPESENLFVVDLASACPRLPEGRLDEGSVAFGTQTHGFAAPEFETLWGGVDDRFDLYSLGATAWHLLTGVNPERLAIARGEEYPTLDLGLLSGHPPAVRRLVAGLLAPQAERFASALAVREAAEAVRLSLSSARPIDVRDLALHYGARGPCLMWRLPPDPRRLEIRVLFRDAQGGERRWALGPATTRLDDPRSAGRHGTWEVRILGLVHDEEVESRGVELRSERYPAPTTFGLSAWFGGVRAHLSCPSHASGAIVRAARGAPPAGPEEGVPLHVDATGRGALDSPPGVEWHAVAFARYGDALSSPRFGSAVALPPLPPEVFLRGSQREEGVELRWEPPLAGAFVAMEPEQSEHWPRPGDTLLRLALPLDGKARSFALRVRVAGVTSDALATFRLERWPPPPALEVAEGAAALRLSLASPAGSAPLLLEVADAPPRRVAPQDFPLTLPWSAGSPARLRLRSLQDPGAADEDARGPVVERSARPPRAEEWPRLLRCDRAGRVAFALMLHPATAEWTGTCTLNLRRGDELVASVHEAGPDLAAALEQVDLPGEACARERPPPIGQAPALTVAERRASSTMTPWSVELLLPDGSVHCAALRHARAPISPPTLLIESALGAVHVQAGEGAGMAWQRHLPPALRSLQSRLAARLGRDANCWIAAPQAFGALALSPSPNPALPDAVERALGLQARVRMEGEQTSLPGDPGELLHVAPEGAAGDVGPFLPALVLGRPPAPAGLATAAHAGGALHLRWSPGVWPDLRWEIEGVDHAGRRLLLHEGDAPEALLQDPGHLASAALRALRHGVRSAPLELLRPEADAAPASDLPTAASDPPTAASDPPTAASPPPTAASPPPTAVSPPLRPAPQPGLRATARILRVPRIGALLEAVLPSPDVTLLVLGSSHMPPASACADPDALRSGAMGVRARIEPQRVRTLLPLPQPDPVLALLLRHGGAEAPWEILRAPAPAPEGCLIGATLLEADQVALRLLAGTLQADPLGHLRWARGWRDRASRPLARALAPLRTGERAVLSLQDAMRARDVWLDAPGLLLAFVEEPLRHDELLSLLWQDAAVAWLAALLEGIRATLGAVVASRRQGPASVTHLLVAGEQLTLEATLEKLDARGALSAELRIIGRRGLCRVPLRLPAVAAPVAWEAQLQEALARACAAAEAAGR